MARAAVVVLATVGALTLGVSDVLDQFNILSLGNKSRQVLTLSLPILTVLVSVSHFLYARVAIVFKQTLEKLDQQRNRIWTPESELEWSLLEEAAETPGAANIVRRSTSAATLRSAPEDSALFLSGVELENIRCFERLAVGFEDEQGPFLTTVILGDNAAGKTTLLRSIALGLCQESDAVTLMRTLPGSFLRQGAERGVITVHVRSSPGGVLGRIETTIEGGRSEVIRQKTWPEDFPWDKVFMCGYGTHRSAGRPSSFEDYTPRIAVSSLFSDTADLLNPEVVLLRRSRATRRRFENILKQVLLLEDGGEVHTEKSGIELVGPWGAMPIEAMSDGYRSTTNWILDYLGWQMFADRLKSPSLNGLLLIDELEQHLHPRWQRYILQRLRSQLGQTQIFASTHTPLVAAGIADLERSQVIRLMPRADGAVVAVAIPPSELSGKRADQVLADAFGLLTSKSPGTVDKIDRYTELLSQERGLAEQEEFEALKRDLEAGWSPGDNAIQRQADQAVSAVLDEMVVAVNERAAVDAQVRQRLTDLFSEPDEHV